jgi:hypothetical protein
MLPAGRPHRLDRPEAQLQGLAGARRLDPGAAVVRLRRDPLLDGRHRARALCPDRAARVADGHLRAHAGGQPGPARPHLGGGLHLRQRLLVRRYGLQAQPVLLAAHVPPAAQALSPARHRLGARPRHQSAPALLRRRQPVRARADRHGPRRPQPAGGQSRHGPAPAQARLWRDLVLHGGINAVLWDQPEPSRPRWSASSRCSKRMAATSSPPITPSRPASAWKTSAASLTWRSRIVRVGEP